nr:hypothetical protein [uncultured Roseateles sp.]
MYLSKLPRNLPSLDLMLADIGRPSARQLAKALGVSPRTVSRWLATGNASKTAMLALFWMTQWGTSLVHTDAHNGAVLQAALAASLTREIGDMKARHAAEIAELKAQLDQLQTARCNCSI